MNGTKIEIIANNRQWHFVNNFWLSVYLSVASSFSVDSPLSSPTTPSLVYSRFKTYLSTSASHHRFLYLHQHWLDFTDSYHTVSSEHIRVFNLFLILPFLIFTARCYASAVLAMALCLSVRLSVCLSVCPSKAGVLLKRQNVGSHKEHSTIPPGTLVFWCQRFPRNSTGVTPYGAPNAGGMVKNRRLSTNNRPYVENSRR